MHKTTQGRDSSGSNLRVFATLFLGLVAFANCPSAKAKFLDSHGQYIDIVNQEVNNSQQTVWRIDQPNIAQLATSYPQIQFLPGDKFKVLAGGCDQTGGTGRTWKLYVNPQGDNTNVLYHGLIYIGEALPAAPHDPSLAKSLYENYSRLSDFGVGDGLGGGVPLEHYIPDPLPDGRDYKKAPIVLNLGFEDDDYGDNGYYSRDPGNNDQCVNVASSWLIITIGHHGAIPDDPKLYYGIKPEDFDCQAGWAFENEGTPELSYATFQTAFQITTAGKYLNPFNEILYQTQKGIASSGNCAGMSLLSVAGEDQFVVGDLQESFWHNYKYKHFSQTPANIQFDVNVAQWQQLSGYFIHNWLDSIESDASTIVSHIEHDLTFDGLNYNYGLLTLKHGGSGHVVVPLAVTHSGDHTYIEVYNPDRPCPAIPNTAYNPKVDIVGQNWSFDMGSLGVWTGENGVLGLVENGMGYVPYHGPDDGWTDQVTSLGGLATAIFGADVSVDQVSDSKGRKLIVDGKVDASDKGLGRKVVLLPNYAASESPKRPRSGDKNKVLKVERETTFSPAQQAVLAQFDKDYALDYEKSGLVYVITDSSLTDLTFTLSSKKAGKPVRALVNQNDKFIEVKTQGAASGEDLIHPILTVHSLADLPKGGLTLSSAGAKALKVTFTHSAYDGKAKTETMQQSNEIAITTAAKAQIVGDDLGLFTAEPPAAAAVMKQTIEADGKVTQAPLRHATTAPIQ